MSDYAVSYKLQEHILEWIAGVNGETRYMALSVDKPNANGTFTEVTGTGYARANLYDSISGTHLFPQYTGNSGYLASQRILSFAQATGSNWTQANYWAIMTAVTGGDLLTWNRIYPGVIVPNSEYFTLPVGEVILRCPTQ